jgi:hypothetical protein
VLFHRGPDKRESEQQEKAAARAVRLKRAAARLLLAIPFFVLAGVIAAKALEVDRAWPVGALLLLGVVVAVVPWEAWRTMLANVEKAQVGPISLDLRHDVERAAAIAPPSDRGEGGDESPDGEAEGIFELRMRLEWKLAYVGKHLLAVEDKATFLTIGSLRFDGYLTETEARTAIGILSAGEDQVRAMRPSEKDAFLKEAGEFVDSVRASIFWGAVKRRVVGRDHGADSDLYLGDVPGGGRRKDILAGEDGREFWIAPAFALDRDSGILEGAVERLETTRKRWGTDFDRRLIVVPDRSNSKAPEARVRVVKLGELRDVLEAT